MDHSSPDTRMTYARQTPARQTLARRKDSLAGAAARGFTLLELMVVVVIIGVLAALIAPAVLERAEQAKVTAARTDVSNLMNALKLYRLANGRYPSGEQGLDALVNKPTAGAIPGNWKPYLDKLPADPWQHPYQYAN